MQHLQLCPRSFCLLAQLPAGPLQYCAPPHKAALELRPPNQQRMIVIGGCGNLIIQPGLQLSNQFRGGGEAKADAALTRAGGCCCEANKREADRAVVAGAALADGAGSDAGQEGWGDIKSIQARSCIAANKGVAAAARVALPPDINKRRQGVLPALLRANIWVGSARCMEKAVKVWLSCKVEIASPNQLPVASTGCKGLQLGGNGRTLCCWVS
jgi:hypothetical protein